ncbi:MAG: ABC transporter permease [Chloroflexi bacterium]|nr:ABC transporter permease [Chloroflexota bacterium]
MGVFLRRFLARPSAVVGMSIILALALLAILAPLIARYDPIEMVMVERFEKPSLVHPLGTDEFGRDVLTRILYGARISLQIGIITVGIGLVFGMTLGVISGYFGGWVDLTIQRVIDTMLAFPGLLLALSISAVLGPGLENAMIAVGIGTLPTYTRLARGSTLSVREREFVEAARCLGAGHLRIMVCHIVPNVLTPMVVLASLSVATAILSAASLSFVGLGAQPPSPEWGAMLSTGRNFLRQEWWLATFPGIAIMLAVLGFNLLGDGLRDALDPRRVD